MNQSQWLASDDPRPMLAFADGRFSDSLRVDCARKPQLWCTERKLRLFEDACFAMFGLNIDDLPVQQTRPAGAAALMREVFGNPFRPLRQASYDNPYCPNQKARHPDTICTCPPWLTPTVLSLAQAAYSERVKAGTLDPFRLALVADALEEAGCTEESLLRHLRGWRRHITRVGQGPAGRKSDRIDRGWIQDEASQIHVRGCWAIDLILGKS